MAELVSDDILEKIMIGFDVKDLIRCKCVCKSWKSFISSSRFVKAQLTYSYNNDHNNNKFRHRRIIMPYKFVNGPNYGYCGNNNSLVGSSNGLVCLCASLDQVLVANPSTREVKILQNPILPECIEWLSLCWGFGYDKSTDDYKVIVGFMEGNATHFQVLNLKSNVWKVVGEVNYTCITQSWRSRRIGTICNGALHWFMKDHRYNKGVIISFDLYQEEFKQVPQPQDARYQYDLIIASLGIFEECLCIFQPYRALDEWVMKKYNVQESWALLPYVREKVNDVVHYLERDYNPYRSFFIEDCMFESTCWVKYLCAPIFVQSIVSPRDSRKIDR